MKSQLHIRIDSELKNRFVQKSQAEFGSATRCLLKFIEAYSKDTFYANDKALGMLYVAIQSLHSYTNNLNQIAKKLNAKGELDPGFTPEMIVEIRYEISQVVRAFKAVVNIDTSRMESLMNEQRDSR